LIDLLSHALLRNAAAPRVGTWGLTGRLKARDWHSPCNGCANRTLSEWAVPLLTNVLILASGFAYRMQTCRVFRRPIGDPNTAE